MMHLVAVIASRADLEHALRLRSVPDFFELRLDALPNFDSTSMSKLGAPVILTARDPAEGGVRNLSARDRRRLVERFADSAAYFDIELRSIRFFRDLLHRRTIISFHDFGGTPPDAVLRRKLNAASAIGADIFKVATRLDNESQLARLLRFFDEGVRVMPIAAMGIGALGRKSRIELARRGSVLNYGYLTRPQAPGQLSLAELRRLLRR